ncbi:MAG: aldehyde dehydrogenase family protein [Acidobacteriota bacterium]|nr:aldehyde dehydrogenase family protein [Acidobacteriota bacterium]
MAIARSMPASRGPGEELIARDPASGAPIGSVPATAPEDVAAVVREVSGVQPLWALLRVEDRARYMRRVAQAMIDERDDLIETLAREQARPRAEVATLEVLPAIEALLWMAERGARSLALRRVGVPRLLFPRKSARIAFEPFGVIGVIGAGSAPLVQPLGQIAGALLAGNGVVFKPARRACLAGERIGRVLGRAGLPEGLVRIVGGGADVGMALAEAPIDKVLFTGSPAIGRAVARACVSREREVTVELGGKDAMLVLADANLEAAARCALWAGCAGAGQARGAIERVYVARAVYDDFLALLTRGAGRLRVGDPADPAVQVGPLASRRRLERVEGLVSEAVAEGARVLCGGPGPGAGGEPAGGAAAAGEAEPARFRPAYYRPTVLADATHAMRIMREPVDGPVLAVCAVDSTDEALRLINDCELSLGASIWTADRYHGLRIARDLRAGMVWLNDHLPSPGVARGPWGAFAGGGIGKTLGIAGLRACAQEKLITRDPAQGAGLWWGPYDELSERAALAVIGWRSARRQDRDLLWRAGAVALARLAARALRGRAG